MPSSETPISHNRKRKLSTETESATTPSSSPPSPKRQRLEICPRHRTPPSFWDNLSRVPLVPRALREFDRRTKCTIVPSPPSSSYVKREQVAQLKRFARQGGPSLNDIRTYPEPSAANQSTPVMSSRDSTNVSDKPPSKTSTRKSSAYDGGFGQHLADNGILMNYRAQKADNWEEINIKITQPRPSLSPSRFSDIAFERFQQANEEALTEKTVMRTAFPTIAGSPNIPHAEDLPFGNLKDLTDGSLTKARPDFYDGSRPAELNKRVREELGEYIVPSTNKSAPCLPNFFVEGKGPTGSAPVAKRQALYDGALGARGIHQLRSYVDPETATDNNAYTITSTYHGGTGTLTMYTTHPTLSASHGNSVEYRMTQLNSFAMTGNPDSFRQGAAALRNARDWAKEKREALISAANNRVLDNQSSTMESPADSMVSPSTNGIAQLDSDTSTDELAMNTLAGAGSARSAPATIRSNQSSRPSSKRRLKKKAFRAEKRSAIVSKD